MSTALTLAGIALVSLIAAGLLTVIAVGVAEIFRGDDPSASGSGNGNGKGKGKGK